MSYLSSLCFVWESDHTKGATIHMKIIEKTVFNTLGSLPGISLYLYVKRSVLVGVDLCVKHHAILGVRRP